MDVLKITKDNFEQEVVNSDVPVLIDFWAVWCGPCKMQAPVLEEIAETNGSIRIGKVNVDEEQMLAMKYGISSIPTMILFKEGKEDKRIVGLHSKEQLASELGL